MRIIWTMTGYENQWIMITLCMTIMIFMNLWVCKYVYELMIIQSYRYKIWHFNCIYMYLFKTAWSKVGKHENNVLSVQLTPIISHVEPFSEDQDEWWGWSNLWRRTLVGSSMKSTRFLFLHVLDSKTFSFISSTFLLRYFG